MEGRDFVRCDIGGDWVATPARFEFFFFFFVPRKVRKRKKGKNRKSLCAGTWEVRARSRLSKGANERPRWRIFRECHVAGAGQDGQDGRQDGEGPVRCKRVQKESERNEGKRGRASEPMRA